MRSGGHVAWQLGTHVEGADLVSGGPVLLYNDHRGVHHSVHLKVPSVGTWAVDAKETISRLGAYRSRLTNDSLTVTFEQAVSQSDSLISVVSVRNTGDDVVQFEIEATIDVDDVSTGSRQRSIRQRQHGLDFECCLETGGTRDIYVFGRANVAEVPDHGMVLSIPSDFSRTSHTRGRLTRSIELAPGDQYTFRCAFALSEEKDRALVAARVSTMPAALAQTSREWIAFLGSCPTFACSEASLEGRFATDWVEARACSVRSTRGANPYPAIYADVDGGSTVSAECAANQIRCNRWSSSAQFGASPVLNFLHFQRPDGALPTAIRYGRCPEYGPTMPDWSAFWDHYLVHPDVRFLRRVYHGMADYAHFVDRVGDSDRSFLVDAELVLSRAETIFTRGQSASPSKGLSNSVRLFKLKRALAKAAWRLGMSHDAEIWRRQAATMEETIRQSMWDPKSKRFCDIDKQSGRYLDVDDLSAVQPFLTSIAGAEHLDGLPVLPRAASDVGRVGQHDAVQPELDRAFLNVTLEAHLLAGVRFDLEPYIDRAATFILRMTRFASRLSRPASVGASRKTATLSRDLVVRYLCGVTPGVNGVTIRPLDFPVGSFTLDKLVVRNNHVGVWRSDDRFGVKLDGEEIANAVLGEAIELDIPL